ncbi:hypothetical protein [Mycobacteroides abscessus]|uniref:hypothetical protein n=1 Tax=Mycobacteroides abscessus TaxID=36809 RepID=UPI0012FFDA58|nr:hypothetical protein [Mycobacteroides abscessus]
MLESDLLALAIDRLNAVDVKSLSLDARLQFAQAVGLVELAVVLRGLAPVVSKALGEESASNQHLAAIAASSKEIQVIHGLDYAKRHGESPSEGERRRRVSQSRGPDLGSYLADTDESP